MLVTYMVGSSAICDAIILMGLEMWRYRWILLGHRTADYLGANASSVSV